jgi:hypothetical protein
MKGRAGHLHARRGADSRWREIQDVSAPESRMQVGAGPAKAGWSARPDSDTLFSGNTVA